MWESELFQQRLEKTMHESFNHVWNRQKTAREPARHAIAVGVERIAEATELRGLFP